MIETTPEVFLIARPQLNLPAIYEYLDKVGGTSWMTRLQGGDAEILSEFMGRLCYRSWEPGLNPNVTKVRSDSRAYHENVLRSAHGSVLEHASYTFVFHNVSRVFTHELVRHRAGTAMWQESLRYVRLEDIPIEHPDFVRRDPVLWDAARRLVESMEAFQILAAQQTGINEPGVDFARKKTITSAMRRYAPDGLATSIGWTCNVRALRHVVAMRTDKSAEDEIRRVFRRVGEIMKSEAEMLFQDFTLDDDGQWVPGYRKV